MSTGWKFYWALVVATLVLYFVMVLWSLPFISQAAGGLVAFDLRPTGYSYEAAVDFLSALSNGGRAFYADVQHRLDMAYPVMLASVLVIGLWRLSRGWNAAIRVILITFPLVGAVADYLENNAVAAMLHASGGEVIPEMVAISSRWTIVKSGATTMGMVALLGLLLLAWARKIANRKATR